MLLTLVFAAAMVAVQAAPMRRVCYYTNWAQYRNGPAKFFPENVDPNLCTHIIYAFAKLAGNKLTAFEWNDESTPWMKGMYERFAAIKQTNPSVKLLLSVGGWNMASAPFTAMVATDASRREFATDTVQFLRKHNFDGIDIDWEYPANRGSPAGDKLKYTQLLQTIHDEFAREAVPAGKDRLMLAAAVAAGKSKIDTAYEVPDVCRLLDMVNLMSYDLHGAWEDVTGHVSPLYGRTGEIGNQTTLNVDWAAQYWVSKGCPKDKMNIGLSMYGRDFKLPWAHTADGMGAPAAGAGPAGLYTREAGFISYYEVCKKLAGGATRHYEAEQKVPYFVDGDMWCGYEDADSLKLKVDYTKQEGFGGIMVWALDLDDFSGSCGQGKYPLMRAIVDEINAVSPVQPMTPAPTTPGPIVVTQPPVTQPPVTRPPITQAPITPAPVTSAPVTHAPQTSVVGGHHHQIVPVSVTEFNCVGRNDGYYPSPTSCSEYYICAAAVAFKTDCHLGLFFNPISLYCDFGDHVSCRGGATIVTSAPHTMAPYVPPVTAKPVTQAPWQPPQPTQPPQTQPPVTQAPQTTTTTQTAPGPTQVHPFCQGKADGFYRDPTDCSYFYQCSFQTSYHDPCPSGTYFSNTLQGCDWAANVPGCP